MIARGSVSVVARRANGTTGEVDVLDLDEESFRAFVVWKMARLGIVTARRDPKGELVVMYERGARP